MGKIRVKNNEDFDLSTSIYIMNTLDSFQENLPEMQMGFSDVNTTAKFLGIQVRRPYAGAYG